MTDQNYKINSDLMYGIYLYKSDGSIHACIASKRLSFLDIEKGGFPVLFAQRESAERIVRVHKKSMNSNSYLEYYKENYRNQEILAENMVVVPIELTAKLVGNHASR